MTSLTVFAVNGGQVGFLNRHIDAIYGRGLDCIDMWRVHEYDRAWRLI